MSNLLCSGLVCKEAREWLVGANVHALPKPTGGLGPVAVVETMRRLVSRMTIAPYKDRIDNYLGFMQVGVGIAGGAEAMIQALRQWKHRNKDDKSKVVVLTDLSNAFNNLDRTALREIVRNVIPEAGPRVAFCCAENSWLRLGKEGTWLESVRGIRARQREYFEFAP